MPSCEVARERSRVVAVCLPDQARVANELQAIFHYAWSSMAMSLGMLLVWLSGTTRSVTSRVGFVPGPCSTALSYCRRRMPLSFEASSFLRSSVTGKPDVGELETIVRLDSSLELMLFGDPGCHVESRGALLMVFCAQT